MKMATIIIMPMKMTMMMTYSSISHLAAMDSGMEQLRTSKLSEERPRPWWDGIVIIINIITLDSTVRQFWAVGDLRDLCILLLKKWKWLCIVERFLGKWFFGNGKCCLPLSVVDIEMFTDEEAKGAEGAKNEQQEGREELIVKDFVTDVKSESEREYQEWAAGRQRGTYHERFC